MAHRPRPLLVALPLLSTALLSTLAKAGEEGSERDDTAHVSGFDAYFCGCVATVDAEDCGCLWPKFLLVWLLLTGMVVAFNLLRTFHRRRILFGGALVQARILEHRIPDGDPPSEARLELAYDYAGRSFTVRKTYGYSSRRVDIAADAPSCPIYVDPLRPSRCLLAMEEGDILRKTSPFGVFCTVFHSFLTMNLTPFTLPFVVIGTYGMIGDCGAPHAFAVFLLLVCALFVAPTLLAAACYGCALPVAGARQLRASPKTSSAEGIHMEERSTSTVDSGSVDTLHAHEGMLWVPCEKEFKVHLDNLEKLPLYNIIETAIDDRTPEMLRGAGAGAALEQEDLEFVEEVKVPMAEVEVAGPTSIC